MHSRWSSMEVGNNRSRVPCSIRRPVHPPPPPPPPLKQRLGIIEILEDKSTPQEPDLFKNLDSQTASSKQNAPLRRAPPPPLPRAPRALQNSSINCALPSQPQYQPSNSALPMPPPVRSTLSVSRSISAMQMKTSAPVSVVRPYNFPPLPSPPSFHPENECSEIYPVKPAPNSSPDRGSPFDSFKDPAQDEIRSSSPSFLDELQQAFPLLRQESKALTSHPRCASSKYNKDDLIESKCECETSTIDQGCFPTAARIADASEPSSPSIRVISQPPLPCPPVITTLQRRASVPVISQTSPSRKPTTSEKPTVSHPQLLRNASFNTANALFVQRDLKHQAAPLRPVFKSSSLKELTIRTLPPPPVPPAAPPAPPQRPPAPPQHQPVPTKHPPTPHQRPPLPPRPQSFLIPPPPPRRRESPLLKVITHLRQTFV